MSAHPNVILKLTIKPDGTTRKLLRDLLSQNRTEIPDSELPIWLNKEGDPILGNRGKALRVSRDEDQLLIGPRVYRTLVMESEYNDSWQIASEEGDLIIFDLVTYGYGEEVSWDALRLQADQLEAYARERHLRYELSVTANYW